MTTIEQDLEANIILFGIALRQNRHERVISFYAKQIESLQIRHEKMFGRRLDKSSEHFALDIKNFKPEDYGIYSGCTGMEA